MISFSTNRLWTWCLCVLSKLAILTTHSAEPMVILIIHVIFVPNANYNMWIKDVIDGTIISLCCCSSSRKSLPQLTVSSQPKVIIIKYDIIDFILTIDFETFFDGTTISLSLMLLLIVNVFDSVHESLLQLNVSSEPKVTYITYDMFDFDLIIDGTTISLSLTLTLSLPSSRIVISSYYFRWTKGNIYHIWIRLILFWSFNVKYSRFRRYDRFT